MFFLGERGSFLGGRRGVICGDLFGVVCFGEDLNGFQKERGTSQKVYHRYLLKAR